jgi:uncharacterized protein (TIRG00374 family)
MTHRTRFAIGMVVSLVLLGWVVWRTDWAEVYQRLREADPILLLVAFLLALANLVMRAWRWRIMLEPEDSESPFNTIFDIVNLGYLANNILPARLGDILRGYLAGEWTRASLAYSLSTTVVERILDTLVVVLLLFATLPFLPVPEVAARTGVWVGIAFLLAAAAFGIAAWQREWSERLLRRLLLPLPLDEQLWGARLVSLLDGFSLVRQPGRLARVLVVTAGIWIATLVSYWLTIRAFGMDALSLLSAAFVLSLGALGMAAPSGPAAAGTFDAAAAWALIILGVAESVAGGIALTIHMISFVAVSLLGVWSLARRGLSLGALAHRAEEAERLQAGVVE